MNFKFIQCTKQLLFLNVFPNIFDGIMSLNGYDYVFQKATGDAEW